MSFLDKSIDQIGDFLRRAFIQWDSSTKNGYLQRIDARIKILLLLFFIIIINLKRDLISEFLIGLLIFLLVIVSRLNLFDFYKKVLIPAFIFGTLLSSPASVNIIMDGNVILPLVHLNEPYVFWIYRIPKTIGITEEGIFMVILLTSKVMNSVGISLLVLYTTPFAELIKALKILRVPDTLLIIINLTYKYIFIFAKTAGDMHLAKKSRSARDIFPKDAKRWIAGRIFLLFKKTLQRSEDINKAMISRGFSGSINIRGQNRIKTTDVLNGIMFFLAGIIILWL